MISKSEIKLAKANGIIDELYEDIVVRLIRKQYTVSRELAVLRQRDSKPEEYQRYDEYAEACKAEAKKILGI